MWILVDDHIGSIVFGLPVESVDFDLFEDVIDLYFVRIKIWLIVLAVVDLVRGLVHSKLYVDKIILLGSVL